MKPMYDIYIVSPSGKRQLYNCTAGPLDWARVREEYAWLLHASTKFCWGDRIEVEYAQAR